jgi:Uma2 family endonuclease
LNEANLRGAPDLVVEVLSPSTRRRDLSSKLRLYERSGVAEYWVIDPEEDTVEVYRLDEGGYRLEARLSSDEGHTLSSPLFPGWAIALEELFHPLSE